jgi:hypothetical protein
MPITSLQPDQSTAPAFLHVQVDLAFDQYSDCYRKLKKAVMKAPRVLDVELTFCTDSSPEFCLMIYELLTTRKHQQTEVQTTSRCSLRDGSLLMLLCGSKRSVSPYVWFQLTDLECIQRNQPDDEEGTQLFREERFGVQGEHCFVSNYRSCLKIISKYLPINRLSRKRYNAQQVLGEFGLLS